MVAVLDIEEPGRLADVIASHLSLKVSDKQSVLEAANIKNVWNFSYSGQ